MPVPRVSHRHPGSEVWSEEFEARDERWLRPQPQYFGSRQFPPPCIASGKSRSRPDTTPTRRPGAPGLPGGSRIGFRFSTTDFPDGRTPSALRLIVLGGILKKKATRGANVRKTVFENGLTLITEPMPSVRSVSIGIWLRTGSRTESAESNGITHFL